MATVRVDVKPFHFAREVDGVLVQLRRNILVQDLEPGATSIDDALAELDERGNSAGDTHLEGVLPHSRLDPSSGSAYFHLILIERNPRVLDEAASKVLIELVYRSCLGDSQNLSDPPMKAGFVGEMSASLEQVPSCLDKNGAQITVAHTYATGGPPGTTDGVAVTQGGEVTVTVPQKTLVLRGLLSVAEGTDPSALCDALLNKTNSDTFKNGAAGTWLCTAAEYNVIKCDFRPWTVRYRLEFQYKAAGWDPQIFFKDERTGQAPSGLVENTGYKTVAIYTQIAYASYLPTII